MPFGATPARMGEGGRPIFCDVLVEQDASLSIAQEPRQRSLPVQEWKLTQILAIALLLAIRSPPAFSASGHTIRKPEPIWATMASAIPVREPHC
jgi:hypothetical protein